MRRRGLDESRPDLAGRQSRWATREGREMRRAEQKGHECKRPRERQSEMAKLYRGQRCCGRESQPREFRIRS